MATVAQIRTQIQSKIFNQYGKSVVLQSAGAHTYDERGQIVAYASTTSNITVVPYDITADKQLFERYGDTHSGDLFFAVPYTVTVNIGDRITMDGFDWDIQEVVNHYLPTNLVTIIRVARIVA